MVHQQGNIVHCAFEGTEEEIEISFITWKEVGMPNNSNGALINLFVVKIFVNGNVCMFKLFRKSESLGTGY